MRIRRFPGQHVWLLLALAWGVGLPARGAGPELLVPVERLEEGGVEVAAGLRGVHGFQGGATAVSLRAVGASVSRLPMTGALPRWRVVPLEGAREVTLTLETEGARVHRTLPVGPAGSEVELGLEPSAPVKGRDLEARLTVRILDAKGRPWSHAAPPVIRANVGSVEDLEAVGGGVFRARYVLPTTRFPEVAVLVAFAPWPHADAVTGATGALRVPLSTAIELPGRSEPGARLSLRIAGVDYGPVEVDADGRFRIPVVVPPGEGMGQSTVEDRHGNRRVSRMDLRLPAVDPLACVASPSRLPADGVSRARILCALSDARARPVGAGKVALKAQHGRLEGPMAAADGLLEWSYVAPARPFGAEALEASVQLKGILGRESLSISESPAPATGLLVETPEAILHRGGSLPLSVAVSDAQGRPTGSAILDVAPSVGEIPARALGTDGRTRLEWSLPLEAAGSRASVELAAWGPAGTNPARLWSWVEGARLQLAVTDPAGLPVAEAPLTVGGVAVRTGPRGTVSLPLPGTPVVDVLHAEWSGLHLKVHRIEGGPPAVFPDARPPRARAALEVQLGPSLPVNVRLEVRGRLLRFWAETSNGALVPERALEARSSAGRLGLPSRDAEGRHLLELPPGAQLVSVSDVLTGVTAASRVEP